MKKYKKIEMIVVLILTCLLFSCGPRVKNGFVKEGENTYYYVNDKMQKGWQEINEGWYFFFQESGIMAKDTMIIDVDGKEYGFDDNGKMYKNRLTRVDAVRHRLDEKGRDVSRDNCNQTAYFGEDGAMLKNTQKEISGKIIIFDEYGMAMEAPYYSAKAVAGGMYNFYLNNEFPIELSTGAYHNRWIIRERPTIEVTWNTVRISGVVELLEGQTSEFLCNCRLSTVDENGVTNSVVRSARSNVISRWEKTKFEINFEDCLPLYGKNIHVSFYNY